MIINSIEHKQQKRFIMSIVTGRKLQLLFYADVVRYAIIRKYNKYNKLASAYSIAFNFDFVFGDITLSLIYLASV